MNEKEKVVAEALAKAFGLTLDELYPEQEKQDIRKESEDFGNKMYQSYLGFKDAGFTDEQAFKILLTILGGRN